MFNFISTICHWLYNDVEPIFIPFLAVFAIIVLWPFVAIMWHVVIPKLHRIHLDICAEVAATDSAFPIPSPAAPRLEWDPADYWPNAGAFVPDGFVRSEASDWVMPRATVAELAQLLAWEAEAEARRAAAAQAEAERVSAFAQVLAVVVYVLSGLFGAMASTGKFVGDAGLVFVVDVIPQLPTLVGNFFHQYRFWPLLWAGVLVLAI